MDSLQAGEQIRADLTAAIWRTEQRLPNRAPDTVEQVVEHPLLDMENLSRVNRLTIEMDLDASANVLHFIPSQAKNRLMLVHQGHAANWGHGVDATIRHFVGEGFDVLAFRMPDFGDSQAPAGSIHDRFEDLETAELNPVKLFLEPIAVSLTHVEADRFVDVSMTGISGGGWTTTLYAAVDPRIQYSFPVAGSLPRFLRTYDQGDWEQNDAGDIYDNVANYLQLYILGSMDDHRVHLQILNQDDPCCFDGASARHEVYADLIGDHVRSLGSGTFRVFVDPNDQHSISPYARRLMMNVLTETTLVDDGDALYSLDGNWSRWTQGGYAGDLDFAPTGSGERTATWEFSASMANYRIEVTWTSHPNRATNAPFTIYDGDDPIHVVAINQRAHPSGALNAEDAWHALGTFPIDTGRLRVVLSNDADGYVIADALRVTKVDPSTAPPADEDPSSPSQSDANCADAAIANLETIETCAPSLPSIIDDGAPEFSLIGSWSSWTQAGHLGHLRYAPSGLGERRAIWELSLSPGTYEVSATWIAHANRASNAPFIVSAAQGTLGTVLVDQRMAPQDFLDDETTWHRLGQFDLQGSSLRVELGNNADGYVIADAIRVVQLSEASPPDGISSDESANPMDGCPTSETSQLPAQDTFTDNCEATLDQMIDQTVDDGNAGFAAVGNWSRWTKSGVDGDLRFASSGLGEQQATWNFELPAGTYEAYATWTPHANRASNSPFLVYDESLKVGEILVDQRVAPQSALHGGVAWERLGSYEVRSGSLRVALSNRANGYVIADAVRVVRVPDATSHPDNASPDGDGSDSVADEGAGSDDSCSDLTHAFPTAPDDSVECAPLIDRIVDDRDPGFSLDGTWARWTKSGYQGDLEFAASGSGDATATWVMEVANGVYETYATWVAHANRATNAPYAIYDGTRLLATVAADQRQTPSGGEHAGTDWMHLGTYEITSGTLRIVLSNAANGHVIADAVRLRSFPASGI